ncbi:MAG: sensor domain-containing diguanylate cyclase [Geminicoccaceae bacterium]
MPRTQFAATPDLPIGILDILPNPVLVKDADLRYVWINRAFEDLFNVRREDLIGELDVDVFKERQVVQCNGGDRRVLETGAVDEAYETVFKASSEPRETITRKSRLTLADGGVFLLGVMHDITEVSLTNRQLEESKKRLEEQSNILSHMANTDHLTGCLNRRALFDIAPGRFARHRNVGGLFLLDIDFFKAVNDTYGHEAGDAALVHFTDVVRSAIREDDELARLGGEEFAVLLPGASVEQIQAVAERVRHEVEASPLTFKDQTIKLTVSIGAVKKLDDTPFNLDAWLPSADENLYRAKNEGRNRVVLAAA